MLVLGLRPDDLEHEIEQDWYVHGDLEWIILIFFQSPSACQSSVQKQYFGMNISGIPRRELPVRSRQE